MRLTSNRSCHQNTFPPGETSAPRKGPHPLSGQFLIPISSAEISPFVERVQHDFAYDGVYFQCLSDWHDTCLSKDLRSAGGRLLSRWHAARTGIGSKSIDEEVIHGLRATFRVESDSIARCGCRGLYPMGHIRASAQAFGALLRWE